MIEPVAKEDLDTDHPESESKEEEAQVVNDPEMCDDTNDQEQGGVPNGWKSQLRPRSPRTAAS